MHNFVLCNGDTDSIAFKKPDGKPFTVEERRALVDELNGQMDEFIKWEDDSFYKMFIVIKTKNYILQDETGKIKIKGSGLKATTKEKALQRFIKDLIDLLLKDRKDQILSLYFNYAKQILNLQDITEWCMKKTVTKSVLSPERSQERRVFDALKGTDVNEGDKVYMFNRTEEDLCLRERFDGVYDADVLLNKLYDTLCVFDTVIDTSIIPNLSLKRNKPYLDTIADQTDNVVKMVPATSKIKTPMLKIETKKAVFPAGFFQTRD